MIALAQQPAPTGAQLFEPIAGVLQGPRCMNCHTVKAPHQKDVGIPHAQLVVRGADGHGAATLQCAACHQIANSADGKVPGAPNWHLAPLSMKWEGLTQAQICEQIKDPARNGNRRTLHEAIDHMKVDPLVLWAWNPGAGRTTPVISHAEFVRYLEIWAAADGPCPK
ncbi:hypothetical protein ACFOFO_13555 [Undibacterium arcticum]|uniref:Cytochrome c domain-containing protein n=1 Tax=Undibacterium arcticum TaxID=1762892 RepID=A0ABV7F4G9_9BURK